MKNFTLFIIMISFLGTMDGQTTKGTWVIGLHNFSPVPIVSDGVPYNLFPPTNAIGISFGTSKEKINGEVEDDKVNSSIFGLSLNSHYFVADQFAVGLVGNLSSGSTTYKYDGQSQEKSSSTFLLAGPELRYYIDAGEKTKVWLKGGASFGSVSYKYDGESDDPINLSQFGGGAGLSIFPVSTVSIDLGMGYNVLKTKEQSDSGNDYAYINSGLAFDVGFNIFFGGGKKTSAPIPE